MRLTSGDRFLECVGAHGVETGDGKDAGDSIMQGCGVECDHASGAIAEEEDAFGIDAFDLEEDFHSGQGILDLFAEEGPVGITGVEIVDFSQARAVSDLVKVQDGEAQFGQSEVGSLCG